LHATFSALPPSFHPVCAYNPGASSLEFSAFFAWFLRTPLSNNIRALKYQAQTASSRQLQSEIAWHSSFVLMGSARKSRPNAQRDQATFLVNLAKNGAMTPAEISAVY
jgi:hypothetical protein